MTKLVLINPPSTRQERYGVHFRSGGETPPLGLAYLAAVTTHNDIETKIIDGTLSNNYEAIVNEVVKERPKYVGLTASTLNIYNAAKLARMIKENLGCITLIGGAHLTAIPEETMARFPQFDIGIVGEAENSLVNTLRSGITKGLVHKVPLITDLDSLPMPAWDLLPDLKHYCPPVHTVKKLPAMLVISSRGCPGKCTFCDRSIFGNAMRANSAEYVLRMMRELYSKYRIREFQFRDDNFLAFRLRLKELCKLLKEEKLDVTFSILGRPDMVNPEILNLLKEVGCWQIWYGIESGSQHILDVIKKHTKLEQIRQAIHWTKEAKISSGGFFMIGMPEEAPQDIEATIRLSQELELDEAHFTFFTPLPGTEAYATAKEYGIFDDNWQNMSMWTPCFVPNGLTVKQLEHYWKQASSGFYFRPRIVFNYARKLRSIHHAKVYFSGFMSLIEALTVKRYSKNGIETPK